jgi:hypothetical protein
MLDRIEGNTFAGNVLLLILGPSPVQAMFGDDVVHEHHMKQLRGYKNR